MRQFKNFRFNILRLVFVGIALWFGGWLAVPVAAQNNIVNLEILLGGEVNPARQQQWMELLSDVGADSLRMRSARPGDRIEVTSSPVGEREVVRVIGQLTPRNQLALPGGTFALTDRAGIRNLIQQLRDDGPEVALAEKKAFGLTAHQLVELHRDLGAVYTESTRDVPVSHIVGKIRDLISTPLGVTEEARQVLEEDFQFPDEIQGLSSGTVLAAALRPLGLVAAPQRPPGESTQIVIAHSAAVDEHWPIGWPRTSSEQQAAPSLYEWFSVRVENYPLRTVLDAIERAAEVPFVYDYNSLAAIGADLDETLVSLEDPRIRRAGAVRRLLTVSRLRIRYEVRVDENDQPFLWISTLR